MVFRGAYLGLPGDMFMFAHVRGSLATKTTRTTSYHTTLSGRLRAQISPAVLREWECELPLSVPSEVARFKALAVGLYGVGPFAWVPVDASVTNVLTMAASMPGPKYTSWEGPGVSAGAWAVPGMGVVQQSVIPTGSTLTFAKDTPVVPGLPVTGAVYVTGAGPVTVWVRTMDAAGAVVDNVKTILPATQTPTRAVATVPAAASQAVTGRIVVSGASQVGLPSMSWASSAAPWVPGGGSSSVIVEGFDTELRQLDQGKYMYETVSFAVKELASDA